MERTVATSRSAGLSTMPSAMTRQPSFTTGKKMNSIMSCGLIGGGLPPLYRPAACKRQNNANQTITSFSSVKTAKGGFIMKLLCMHGAYTVVSEYAGDIHEHIHEHKSSFDTAKHAKCAIRSNYPIRKAPPQCIGSSLI